MTSDPATASVAYVISQIVLDWIDGDAARYFNQCSNFGTILDIVIDRCVLNGLIVMCSHLYPDYLVLFQLLVFINTACLMLYVLSRKMSGTSGHKKTDDNEFYLVRLYYANTVMFNVFSLVHQRNVLRLFVSFALWSRPSHNPWQLLYWYLEAPVVVNSRSLWFCSHRTYPSGYFCLCVSCGPR